MGLVGRDGALERQPFMVAFFKVSEVRLRTARSVGKRRQPNRNRSSSPQEASKGSANTGYPYIFSILCTKLLFFFSKEEKFNMHLW